MSHADGHAAAPGTNRKLVDLYQWLQGIAPVARFRPAPRPMTILRKYATERLGPEVSGRIVPADPDIEGLDDTDAWVVGYLSDSARRACGRGEEFDATSSFVGYHPEIVGIRSSIGELAEMPEPVLLVGERGTGKGQLMRAIDRERTGGARSRPMQLLSLAAVPRGLADSELFGHEKGAFTDAKNRRTGAIRTATQSGEVLYLDDLGECPETTQVKLLSALDDGIIRPVGSDAVIDIGRGADRKLKIVATIQPESIATMRPDLLDRLWFWPQRLPPLRHRGLDMLLLADLALDAASVDDGPGPRMTRAFRLAVLSSNWPGNVRELASFVARTRHACRGRGALDDTTLSAVLRLDEWRRHRVDRRGEKAGTVYDPDGFPTLQQAADRHVRAALGRTGGNVYRAAKLLDMPRQTLQSRLDRMRRRSRSEASDWS